MYQQRGGGRQVVRLPEPGEVGTLAVRGLTNFARRNKSVTAAYVFGWLFLLFVGQGTLLSTQQKRDYNRIMNTIDLQAEYDATQDYWMTRQAYHASQGWFWTCDSLCQRNKRRFERAERVLQEIRQEGAARTSDAKKVAGLFSEVGVGEVKDSFWQYLYQGKKFAQRQSMWDAMFIGVSQMVRGRDESWLEFGLKVLLQVLMNFTIGLFMALVFFVIGLWSIVSSYQPNPIVAIVAFVGATLAAFAYVATYIVAIYGAAAGGVYGVLKVVETSAHQQRINAQRQQGRMGYRPHYQ